MRGTASFTRGEISLIDDTLVVRVPYVRSLLSSLKRYEGAKYDAEIKAWRLPLVHLESLRKSKFFNQDRLEYNFDIARTEKLLDDLVQDQDRAREVLRLDPLRVPKSIIRVARPDLSFFLSDRVAGSVRCHIRKGSRFKRIVEESFSVVWLAAEDSYLIPSFLVRELVKLAREHDVEFAVEEELSDRLVNTREQRHRALSGSEQLTLVELEEALLTPCLSLGGNGRGDHKTFELKFLPNYITTKLLRLPEPKIGSQSVEISHKQVVNLLARCQALDIPVWLDSQANAALLSERQHVRAALSDMKVPFSEKALVFGAPDLCWLRIGQRSGLLLRRTLLNRLGEIDPERCATVERRYLAAFPDHLFLPLPFVDFNGKFEELSELMAQIVTRPIPQSQGFSEKLREARAASSARLSLASYQEARDLELPEIEPEYAERLYPHQRVAVGWLAVQRECFLADDMGLGKTLAVLSAFHLLQKKGEVQQLLVICPNSLTRNWERECGQWFPGMGVVRISTNQSERRRQLGKLCDDSNSVLVVHYESARIAAVREALQRLVKSRRTMLVLDESQRAKNPSSETFKALKALADGAARRVLMSGTPIPKDFSDIWAQMRLLDGGKRLGSNYITWLKDVAEVGTHFSPFAVSKFKPARIEESVARVKEVLLRRRKSEVLKLPAKSFVIRDVRLTGDQRTRYHEVVKELMMRVTSCNGAEFFKAIDSILEEYLRAVQIASNPRLIDPSWQGEPAKYLELDEIVQEVVEAQSGKIVIWTSFLGNVRELIARYSAYGALPFSGEVSEKDRAQTVLEFQSASNSAPRVLVAIPAAGGVGITLTAAQTCVYLDKSWNAEHWLQSIDRIHRIGQTGSVTVLSLHAGKIDQLIAKSLARKERMLRQLLDVKDAATQEALEGPEDPLRYPSREELLEALSDSSE